jgi:tetratricopeptide (TPR) repeat protein
MAQTRRAAPDLQNATTAYFDGRYDEVLRMVASLDAADSSVAALAARAEMARGRDAEAEARLQPVAAREPFGEAALEYGLLLKRLGRAEADAVLSRVASRARSARDATELARAARALRALDDPRAANDAYREAAAAAPRDVAIQTGWGELFLERFQYADAMQSFEAALREDPEWPPALLGAARALSADNPPRAVAFAQQALKRNPSDTEALVFLASESYDAGRRDDARELVEQALEVNPRNVDAQALLAGFAYVEDDRETFDEHVRRVLDIVPTSGEVFRVAGDLAARNYRFDEAAALARRGLELEPGNSQILADIGVHLLRTGDEPGARTALDRSFAIDPYNPVTFNLLQMMDTLDTFVTVEDGNLVVRMHPDEAPVLRDFAVDLAHQALTTLERRYNFAVTGPILIEIFPKHDDFAVRNVGLPGMIGALGACFGRVVTMDSPRARPPGEFQWEATLWHELAHVVTLQMSNQRVPRWLTEGISVYEEQWQRREWGRGMDVSFAVLLNRGETLALADLNAAFTDPRTISLAYYQASLLVEYMVKTFGDEGLHRLLRAYGQGLDSDEALRAALNTSFDEMQDGFDRMLAERFRDLQAAMQGPEQDVSRMPLSELRVFQAAYPNSFPVQMAYAHALRQTGETDGAYAAFEHAATLVPIATGDDSPNMQIATIALSRKDYPRAIRALEDVLASDFDNVLAARQLAEVLAQAGVTDPARVTPVYQRIAAVDPFDADAHRMLGRLALARNEPDAAAREFRAVLALRPVDRAAALTDLAESYLRADRRQDARRQILAALEIAPSYERAQDLLLELAGDRP